MTLNAHNAGICTVCGKPYDIGARITATQTGWKHDDDCASESSERKLYFVTFRSDAASARDMDSELEGVISLTADEYQQLERLGQELMASDCGWFELTPECQPYTFNEAMEALKVFTNEEEVA